MSNFFWPDELWTLFYLDMQTSLWLVALLTILMPFSNLTFDRKKIKNYFGFDKKAQYFQLKQVEPLMNRYVDIIMKCFNQIGNFNLKFLMWPN